MPVDELVHVDRYVVLDLLGIDVPVTPMKCPPLCLKVIGSPASATRSSWSL